MGEVGCKALRRVLMDFPGWSSVDLVAKRPRLHSWCSLTSKTSAIRDAMRWPNRSLSPSYGRSFVPPLAEDELFAEAVQAVQRVAGQCGKSVFLVGA